MADELRAVPQTCQPLRPVSLIHGRMFELTIIMTVTNHTAPEFCNLIIVQSYVVTCNGASGKTCKDDTLRVTIEIEANLTNCLDAVAFGLFHVTPPLKGNTTCLGDKRH